MAPKKKPKRNRCSSCGKFRQNLEECCKTDDPDVAGLNLESAPATSATLYTPAPSEAGCSTSREVHASEPSFLGERDQPMVNAEKISSPSIKMQECIMLRGELNADI
jgi:hypothetical protein